MLDSQWQPDILGDGYTQAVLELGPDPDGEGPIDAVLVRREGILPARARRGTSLVTRMMVDVAESWPVTVIV